MFSGLDRTEPAQLAGLFILRSPNVHLAANMRAQRHAAPQESRREKLRSAASDGDAESPAARDPRRLRVGRNLRRAGGTRTHGLPDCESAALTN